MQDAFELKNKRVTVVGLGLTGLSCVRFLVAKGAQVVALDTRQGLGAELDVPVYLGEYQTEHLLDADLIILSPGVDPGIQAIQTARDAGIEIIGDVELFARFNKTDVVAITGSNGKSTVTTLVTQMLKADGLKAEMGGNIGIPVLELLELDVDIVVLELSSFQLETLSSLRPVVATILNICDDHLDRHGTMENYRKAKQRIYLGAQHAVYNRDDQTTTPEQAMAGETFGLTESDSGFGWDGEADCITYNQSPYLAMNESQLTGTHNVLNIQAAAACASIAGASKQGIKLALGQFSGLPHRFETVSTQNNVHWINDSKATNVGATVAAISGLASSLKGKLILIAGGDGKGADFSPLQSVFDKSVDVLITLGKDGDEIAALKAGSLSVTSIEQAVEAASKVANSGDVVLLSPACASIDMFRNYQQRGECFARAVKELAA